MRISIITAFDNNGLIGRDNSLPWFVPEDLKRFRALTMGKPMIMGRKTFESFKEPLPGRDHLVLTRSEPIKHSNHMRTWFYTDIQELISLTQKMKDIEFMVIGGAEIYKLFLPLADKLYTTIINGEYEGDTYFPEVDIKEWYIYNSEYSKTSDIIFKEYWRVKNV